MDSTPKIILASKSPRRQELLKLMQIDFEVKLIEVNEDFPLDLSHADIVKHIAENKARVFDHAANEIIITADTLVSLDNVVLGKPKDKTQAQAMLSKLSGNQHIVYTGVCIKTQRQLISFVESTMVTCREVSPEEIDFYIDNFKPFDKAGSYGIQDWWGVNVVSKIEGSYTNVMGLPTEALYRYLNNLGVKLH
ncbi:MAG: septum formation protein Maf [Pedobacter sp.]|nr:MAG: septum formation protein Maf [Pedobacter sp.]